MFIFRLPNLRSLPRLVTIVNCEYGTFDNEFMLTLVNRVQAIYLTQRSEKLMPSNHPLYIFLFCGMPDFVETNSFR